MNPAASILTVPEAAPLVGVPYSTLWGWVKTDPTWSSCISHKSGRRVYLSVQRLRDRGLLLQPTAAEPARLVVCDA